VAYLDILMLFDLLMMQRCIRDILKRVDRSSCISVSQEQVGRGDDSSNPWFGTRDVIHTASGYRAFGDAATW